MHPKEFYKTYWADEELSELSAKLINEITSIKPVHALEFGSGTGKHLDILESFNITCAGIDISAINSVTAITKKKHYCTIYGDETYLRNLCNFDVVFTCSVLDHIEDISRIVGEFKRIANKCVLVAETNDVPGPHYFPHNYEEYGFKKLDFIWKSRGDQGDGASYFIWVWIKENKVDHVNDDLGCAEFRA